MARCEHWLAVLSVASAALYAGCDGIDEPPATEWTALDQLDERFLPDFAPPPVEAPTPHGLRLVTYNVLEGVDVDEDAAFFLSDPDLARADVIGLQETLRPLEGTRSDAGELAERLQMGYVFVPTFISGDSLQGVALLSRFPLTDIQLMRLPDQTDVDVLEQAARAALSATVVTDAGPVRIITVHLDPLLNIPERVLQLRPAVLDTPAPVAVLGDFNTNDYIWAYDTIPLFPLDAVADTSQASALDGYMRSIDYATPTARFGNTWHGFPENQRLDSVFTRGLAAGKGAVERRLDTSDHWPLWLDVTVSR